MIHDLISGGDGVSERAGRVGGGNENEENKGTEEVKFNLQGMNVMQGPNHARGFHENEYD